MQIAKVGAKERKCRALHSWCWQTAAFALHSRCPSKASGSSRILEGGSDSCKWALGLPFSTKVRLQMLTNICRVGVRRMGPNSFQWCPATGQGATGTNWSRGSSSWIWRRTSSLWGWRSTGTGCPGWWWSLLLWRYSRPAWTRSSAACCRWPCCGRRVGPDDPQRSLPTLTILWLCDSLAFPTTAATMILSNWWQWRT